MTVSTQLSIVDSDRVDEILARYREPVLAEMRLALHREGIEHLRWMRYHVGWEDASGVEVASSGGKMLRPALCLLACEAVGGDRERAMSGAAALELVHNFTLIHDDIEDGSATRHGRETLWSVVGIPRAINTGDGMFVIAQRTLVKMTDAGVDAERVLATSVVLNEGCVALCEGQHADIGFETRPSVSLAEYEAMIAGKTAALLGASTAIGAIAGGANESTVKALAECGRQLGMAFQIRDDMLGIWGDKDVTGKPVADDLRSRKKSFPVVFAFEHLARDERDQLEGLYGSDDGERVDEILALLERARAREAATATAASWAASALDIVRNTQLDPERRRDLEALASFFVYRSA